MVTHARCDKLADVEKFFAGSGLKLADTQIVHVSTRCAGFYLVFYDDGTEPAPKRTRRAKAEPEKETAEPEQEKEG